MRSMPSRFVPRSSVWYATAALFAVCVLVQPQSVGSVSLNAMLPFAGILAIAAVGQTLVVMQGGIDFSVPGMMTVAGLVVSKYAAANDAGLAEAILIVVAIAIVVGFVNGIVIGFLGVTSLVATLAMNAILLGAAVSYSGGTAPRAPRALSSFALDKTVGVSNVVWLAAAFVALVSFLVAYTVWGRRFVAVGAQARAARAAGIRIEWFGLSAYVVAALCYAAAGIVLAGYVSTPNVSMGDAYLLPAIAAVVIGGTPLGGGKGNVIGTAVGAVFLSQLTQLVVSLGAPTSAQFLVQSGVIAVAAAIQASGGRALAALLRRAPAGRPDALSNNAQPG